MKKIVCLLLALALSIAVFAGCGGNDHPGVEYVC